MCPLLRLFQVIAGAAGQHFRLEGQILIDDLPQRQDLGLLLIVHQGKHNDAEARLQGSLLKQVIEHHLGICVLFQLDNHTHTVAVGLVTKVADAL